MGTGPFIACQQHKDVLSFSTYDSVTKQWRAPDTSTLAQNEEGELIRYGRNLIVNTALFLGPKGRVAALSNGMNCQNCHTNAGTMAFANSFAAVASTYPKYRDRSGRVETIAFRINECMERSLNGHALDTNSREMKAMIAYFKWLGQGVPSGVKPIGAGTQELTFLDRAADTTKGKAIYLTKCQSCHGADGKGLRSADSIGYTYPPLWGEHSFNTSAGMYRLTRLAGFVKNNMPFGATHLKPQLTDEEAWDVAAYVSSRPRPMKLFAYDWPKLETKPVDYPFKPYKDSFSETQHKYGPFAPIQKAKSKK